MLVPHILVPHMLVPHMHKQENAAKQELSSTSAVAPNKSAMFVCKDSACKFTKATTIKEGGSVGETNPWHFQ